MTNLPDLFRFQDGSKLIVSSNWSDRRQELLDIVIPIEYGPIPQSKPVRAELLSSLVIQEPSASRRVQYRLVVETEPAVSFILNLQIPQTEYPLPVVLDGDLCWPHLTDDIAQLVLSQGYILAAFDRTEIVPDQAVESRDVGLYAAFPKLQFGALSAWAWGYHRAVDFLHTLPEVDAQKIAISGHSRGGKAVLLAGATDERIALTNPNDSGCGGAGCFRIENPKSETLEAIVTRFPYWFHPDFKDYIGRESELPFDQHFLKAAVAPRILLTTEALDDLWANPYGTWHTHAAVQEVYKFLGIEEKIGIWYRPGGHGHGPDDFKALLDFANWQFFGKEPAAQFNQNPF